MKNHKIINVEKPSGDSDVANKKYVDESHVTPSGHLGENAFRYLMEDVDESSSENNISVSGIARFDASIHQNDKNAYRITLIKDVGSNDYDHVSVLILVLSQLGIIHSCVNFSRLSCQMSV